MRAAAGSYLRVLIQNNFFVPQTLITALFSAVFKNQNESRRHPGTTQDEPKRTQDASRTYPGIPASGWLLHQQVLSAFDGHICTERGAAPLRVVSLAHRERGGERVLPVSAAHISVTNLSVKETGLPPFIVPLALPLALRERAGVRAFLATILQLLTIVNTSRQFLLESHRKSLPGKGLGRLTFVCETSGRFHGPAFFA